MEWRLLLSELKQRLVVMRNFMSKNLKQSIYWVILFSLMTGLLFSSGEGIRLFPFPVSNNGDVKSSQSFFGKNSSFYNPSTHHSGSSLLKLKTKNQKTLAKILTGETHQLSPLDVVKSFNPRLREVSGVSTLAYKSVHLISLSDRAPPPII